MHPRILTNADLELELQRSASEVLGCEIDPESDFFGAGGTSIDAVRVLSLVRERVDVELDLATFFIARSIRKFSRVAVQGWSRSEGEFDSERRSATEFCGLSYNQKSRLLRDFGYDRENRPPHNAMVCFLLSGEVDIDALASAFIGLQERHDALLQCFDYQAGMPFLLEGPAPCAELVVATVETHDAARTMLRDAADESFDLANSSKIRGILVQVSDSSSYIAIIVDHLASDGHSIGILLRDLQWLYSDRATGQSAGRDLEDAPSYLGWSQFEHQDLSGDRLSAKLSHWRTVLDPAEILQEHRLQGMREPEPALELSAGSVVRVLDFESVERLRVSAAASGLTLYCAIASALLVAVSKSTGQSMIGMNCPLLNRPAGWENCVGWFSRQVPLRARVDRNISIEQVSCSLSDSLGAAMLNSVPQSLLLESLYSDSSREDRWRPKVYLDVDMDCGKVFSLGDASSVPIPLGSAGGLRDGIAVWLMRDHSDTGALLTVRYQAECWPGDGPERFTDLLFSVLKGADTNWQRPLSAWVDEF